MTRLQEHKRLDQIVNGLGYYYNQEGNHKGCHLGCLTHFDDDSHEATERMFGIPERIARLLEAVFEGLDSDKCVNWVIESTEAISVGADLSLAHHHLAAWLLGSESPSALGNKNKLVAAPVKDVLALHQRMIDGDSVGAAEWEAADSAADSAAYSAARAADSADSAAYSAAYSADSAAYSAARAAYSAARAAYSADSAAYSAARAAYSAAYSAADSADSAARAAWDSIAKKSIEIFKSMPVRESVDSDDCPGCLEQSLITLESQGVVIA